MLTEIATTPVVLVLRSAMFYLGYGITTVLMSVLFILAFPLLSARGRHRCAAFWGWLVLGWLNRCCGVSYELKGLDNIQQSPAVYLANHQSSWEAILLYCLIHPLSPILKKELMDIPFWGWALRLTRPIAIDRSRPREAGKSLITQGVRQLREGNSVIVFPEGTRSQPGRIRKFSRSGATLAAEAAVPIVPIAHNAGYVWPPRSFIKYPGKITVEFGPVMPITNQSVKQLTEQAENWVRAHAVIRR